MKRKRGMIAGITVLAILVLVFGGYHIYRYPSMFRSLSDNSLNDPQVEELRESILSQADLKVLVAYFSYSGTTRNVANAISEKTGGVIVLATPVYFYTMCAQMKTMIDRTLGGAQMPGLENKEFYLIATAADGKSAMERTIDGLRGYIECLPGAKEAGVIYGAGAWQLGDILKEPAMQEAYQTGKNIC